MGVLNNKMPTYRNLSTTPITIGHKSLILGKEVQLNEYIDLTQYPSVEKTSDLPIPSLIIKSQEINLNDTKQVTDLSNTVIIRLVSLEAMSKVIVNNDGNEIAIPQQQPLQLHAQRKIQSVKCTLGKVLMEEWNGRSWI